MFKLEEPGKLERNPGHQVGGGTLEDGPCGRIIIQEGAYHNVAIEPGAELGVYLKALLKVGDGVETRPGEIPVAARWH